MYTLLVIVYLVFGGIVAGIVSSTASVASLVSYPLLLSVGLTPVLANVTNDAALIWNGLGSIISSTKELRGHWHQVIVFALFSIIGSAAGCLLLLSFPSTTFSKIVPFLILISGWMVIWSNRHEYSHLNFQKSWQRVLGWLLLIFVGIYDGYFGAASGVMVMVLLTYLTRDNFLVVNAMKNAVSLMSSCTALIVYLFTMHIYWNYAIPLALGMFIGGYIGPIVIRHVSVKWTQIMIAILTTVQAIIYFYQAYFG